MPPSVQEKKLFEAAGRGDLDEVKGALDEGIGPNIRDEFGSTPLHGTAKGGHTNVAELLLERGADQGARDESGSTPLHYAAQHGHDGVVQLLLYFWADSNAKDNSGSIPLHYAANDAVTQLLLGKSKFLETGTGTGTGLVTQTPMFPITINGNDLSKSIEPAVDASQTNYILVQTRKSLSPAQREMMTDFKLMLYDCICINTYLCGYQGIDLEGIRRMDHVVYVDVYRQEFKIDPGLKKKATKLDNGIEVAMVFHDAAKLDVDDIRVQIMNKMAEKTDIHHKNDDYGLKFFQRKAHLTVPGIFLDALASIDEVRKIEEVGKIALQNVQARLIMGVDTPQQPPLAQQGHVYQGEGQVIVVADSGLDTGNAQDIHYAFGNRVRHIYSHPGEVFEDFNGHGTHVCASAVGDGITNNNIHVLGTAPQAQLVVQPMWGLALTELLRHPYDEHTVRVHSDSYGELLDNGQQRGYTAWSEEIDSFIWGRKDMVVCWAAGNDAQYDDDAEGALRLGQIGSHAAAKNCITVGASENNRPDMEVTYAMWLEGFNFPPHIGELRMGEDPSRVAAFSSRGPTMTDDRGRRRIKPDVVAPGTLILSAHSSRAPAALRPLAADNRWCYKSGTSMATPLVAGCAAVLREAVLHNNASPPQSPSAALIKALLVNGADAISHPTPNAHSGFGRVNLAKSLTAACGDQGTGLVEHEVSNAAGLFSTEIQVTEETTTLKATLVWSDPPENGAIRNQLRLEVRNNIDAKHTNHLYNNVHQVVWENIPPGQITVIVGVLGNLDVSPQPFAVVWRLY